MAEFSKYKAYSVGRLLLHNNRVPDDGVEHSNKDIDNERTMFNYHLQKGTVNDVQKRLAEVFAVNRRDQTVLGEMIVTLPKNVRKEDERDFFTAVYDFYCQDLGEKNIINAVVHKDEKTPHIHIDFVPVVKGNVEYGKTNKALEKWKEQHGENVERLCCKDLINRKYLSAMHTRLSDFVEERLGYCTEIINGATANGNKTVMQLKTETLKKEIELREKQRQYLNDDIQKIYKLAQKFGIGENDIGLLPLMDKIDDLENQNRVLQEIISRNNYTYSRQDIEKLRVKKFTPSQSAGLNVFDGSLTGSDIPQNAVVVIEIFDQKPRPSPQQKLIDSDSDIYRQAAVASSSNSKAVWRNSSTNGRLYLFLKTDSERQTMQTLIEAEQRLREVDLRNRKLFMDRMESDTYDIARSILTKLEIDAQYYTRRDLRSKTESKEAELHKQ